MDFNTINKRMMIRWAALWLLACLSLGRLAGTEAAGLSAPTSALMMIGRRSDVADPSISPSGDNDASVGDGGPEKRRAGLLSLRPIIKKCLSFIIHDKDVLSLLSSVTAGTMWIFIFMSIIGTLGLDTKPLVSLVTVSGFTFGLAAKDILTSTIAAAYMISMRPFKRDMIISIGEHKGRVRSFDTNFVKLVTVDNRLVLIPMASVYGKPIIIEEEAAS